MNSPGSSKLGYIPALDGVRGVAVLLVMLSHTNLAVFTPGWLGVDVFFALSGFLITSLIVGEYQRTGSVALGPFYKRRALRLIPCFALVLTIVLLIQNLWPDAPQREATITQAQAAVFYVANWHEALMSAVSDNPLVHTWSLAIEDQFYIIWVPLLAFALLRSVSAKRLALFAVAGAIVSAALCAVLIFQPAGYTRAYFGTDTRLHTLLIGCVAGLLFTGYHIRISRRWLMIALTPALAFYAWATLQSGLFVIPRVQLFLPLGTVAVAIGTVALCMALASGSRGVEGRALAFAPLVRIGVISYGLYLWHVPVFWFLTQFTHQDNPLLLLLVGFPVSFAIAALSYRYVERPFLRLKYAKLRAPFRHHAHPDQSPTNLA